MRLLRRGDDEHSGHLFGEFTILVDHHKIRVAADVHTVDEDVGDSSLAGLLLEGVLNSSTVGNLIELDKFGGVVFALEQILGCCAVGARRLAVDHDLVGCDRGVDLSDQIVCLGHLCCLSFFEKIFLINQN